METVRFHIFLSPEKIKLSEAQEVLIKRNLIFSSQQYNYSKRNLHAKGYRSKFADGNDAI